LNYRIRVAGIMLDAANRLLLAHEHTPDSQEEFWTLPGGGQESQDKSVFEALRREFLEETGLEVETEGRLLYFREFIESSRHRHHLELAFLISRFTGELSATTIEDVTNPQQLERHTRWFHAHELVNLPVYPTYLKDRFWDDILSGSVETRYLGVEFEQERLP